MEIEKYDSSNQSTGKMTKDATETRLLSERNSDSNVHSLVDFLDSVTRGSWGGGYVEGLGYVDYGDFVLSDEESEYGSDMLTFIHGSSYNEDDFEAYCASMFSYMNSSNDTENSGDTGNNTNTPSGSKMYYDEHSYGGTEFKIDVKRCIILNSVVYYFYLTTNTAKNINNIKCIVREGITETEKNLLSKNGGSVKYDKYPIGNCAFHLNNGIMNWSISLEIIYDYTKHISFDNLI